MPQSHPGKPSLIDAPPSPGGPAHDGDTSIRMLDALEPAPRRRPGATPRRGVGWGVATLLLFVACGASWSWWNQRPMVVGRPDPVAMTGAGAGASATAASAPATAVAEPAAAATIVAMPQPMGPSPGAVSLSPPVEAPAKAAVAAATQPLPAASVAPHVAARSEKSKTPGSTATREARTAATSSIESRRSARDAANTGRGAATARDPDVALLSAMLATMSRDARTAPDGTPGPQAQMTIAQLVQRCEMNGIKDAIETFECKRRICDGYWGKADACPMSLSPKKN